MKRAKKALSSLAIAGMALTMIPVNVFAAGTVPTRISGNTAEQTAVQIAEKTGWSGTAILASSASYGMVDALTAGPLATFLKAPILLTEPGNELNADTKAELTKLNVKTVYVTSGTGVIRQAVLDELTGMGITVTSLGGVDRFATATNIANKMVSLGANISKVAVAYGWKNQDALSIASIASAQTEPILLTEKDSIPASVKAFMATNTSVKATDVIGGTGVISDVVKAQFPSATRYFGNTAYDTNLAVLKAFDSVLKYDYVYISNGETAIDALAGAPLAAKYKAGIVLTKGTANEATAYVNTKLTSTSIITALGGTAVVPEVVLKAVVDPTSVPIVGGGVGGGGGGGSVPVPPGTTGSVNVTAQSAVVAYETAPITTSAQIAIADGLKLAAAAAVAAVTDPNLLVNLNTRITTRDTAVAQAKVAVLVPSVILNKTSLVLLAGKSETLMATVYPDSATNKNVTWTSDRPLVATVDSTGKVMGVGIGIEAIITVKTSDGLYSNTCSVKVLNEALAAYDFTQASFPAMAGLITSYGAALGLDLTAYNSLSINSQGIVQTALLAPVFTTTAQVQAAINAAVLAQHEPPAPAVTRNDTTNTVSGMAVGMEYSVDGGAYIAYDKATFDALDLSGNHTLLIRIAAQGSTPFSASTELGFTTN